MTPNAYRDQILRRFVKHAAIGYVGYAPADAARAFVELGGLLSPQEHNQLGELWRLLWTNPEEHQQLRDYVYQLRKSN